MKRPRSRCCAFWEHRNEDKRLELFPTGHSLSGYTKETARLVLDWLDRYLGKVNEKQATGTSTSGSK